MKKQKLDWISVLFYLLDSGYTLVRLEVNRLMLSLYPSSFPFWETQRIKHTNVELFIIEEILGLINQNFQFLGKIRVNTWFDVDIKTGTYSYYVGGKDYKGKLEI